MEDYTRRAHERAVEFHRNPQVQIDYSRLSESGTSHFPPTVQVKMPPQQAEIHLQQLELHVAALATAEMVEIVPLQTPQLLEPIAA